jgi:predicted CoA-substrate-specific enzyme activase
VRCAGLDIGSRSVELVVIDAESRQLLRRDEVPTGPAVAEECRRLVAQAGLNLVSGGNGGGPDRLLATGYGRALAEVSFGYPTVTEIKAYARGAEAVHPGCRTVLDVGGQDTKVIAVDGSGRALRFEMNDRCAAGAGRFLEMIAAALHFGIEEFGRFALEGRPGTKINSMCAVFSESEVVGLMTRGTPREDIALAVHEALAQRIASQILRVGAAAPIVFAGGAARNPCLRRRIEERIGTELVVPEEPQMVGALGAALLAG